MRACAALVRAPLAHCCVSQQYLGWSYKETVAFNNAVDNREQQWTEAQVCGAAPCAVCVHCPVTAWCA